ncbi:ribosomal protein S5 domain 2-type protein [Melampsora americana]|nr:ribosomal protein S5 domain 2-type protein [Melampsora americana]
MFLSKTEASYLSESIKPTTESETTHSLRADGRPLLSFRPINIITNVSAQANGSARCQLSTSSSSILTDVMVGCKLEVDERDFSSIGAKVECTVDCPPATLNALASDPSSLYTIYLNSIFSPLGSSKQLKISSTQTWALYIDVIVLSASAGNLMDVMCLAVRAALNDLKIPKTRELGYQIQKPTRPTIDGMEIDVSADKSGGMEDVGIKSFLKSRKPLVAGKHGPGGGKAIDFELQDTDGNLGDRLINKDDIPVVITVNVLGDQLFLDATLEEETLTANRVILSYVSGGTKLTNVIQSGNKSEIGFDCMKRIIKETGKFAAELESLSNQINHDNISRSDAALP